MFGRWILDAGDHIYRSRMAGVGDQAAQNGGGESRSERRQLYRNRNASRRLGITCHTGLLPKSICMLPTGAIGSTAA